MLLNPQAKTCDDIESLTPRAFMADPFQSMAHLERIAQRKTLGTETVAGLSCTHEAFYDKNFKLADGWFALDLGRFPVKLHIVSGRRDGAVQAQSPLGDTHLASSNIQRKSIDPALFAVPEGYTQTASPANASEVASVPGQFKGTAPWGRRLGKGQSMQVTVDPKRPVKVVLRSLADASGGTYVGGTQVPSAGAHAPKSFTLAKKRQRKTVSFSKNEKTQQISIAVDKGLVYAVVSNEKDPFALSAAGKLQDGYLIAKEGQGFSRTRQGSLILPSPGTARIRRPPKLRSSVIRSNTRTRSSTRRCSLPTERRRPGSSRRPKRFGPVRSWSRKQAGSSSDSSSLPWPSRIRVVRRPVRRLAPAARGLVSSGPRPLRHRGRRGRPLVSRRPKHLPKKRRQRS